MRSLLLRGSTSSERQTSLPFVFLSFKTCTGFNAASGRFCLRKDWVSRIVGWLRNHFSDSHTLCFLLTTEFFYKGKQIKTYSEITLYFRPFGQWCPSWQQIFLQLARKFAATLLVHLFPWWHQKSRYSHECLKTPSILILPSQNPCRSWFCWTCGCQQTRFLHDFLRDFIHVHRAVSCAGERMACLANKLVDNPAA